jgi:hypothetical protein
MTLPDQFELAVRYHHTRNLRECLPFIRDGRFSLNGEPIPQGNENDLTRGVLIISNGETLAERLKKDRVIHDRKRPKFASLADEEDFLRYLHEQEDKDGAYIFDGKNSRIARVGILNNDPSPLQHESIDPSNLLPENFGSMDPYGDGKGLDDFIGTKTYLAMILPIAYPNTRSIIVKRSAYSKLGLGLVLLFNNQGLKRDFYFGYDSAASRSGIVGVYRTYKRDGDNRLVVESERHEDVTSYLERE